MNTIVSKNPYTNQIIAVYKPFLPDEIEKTIQIAENQQKKLQTTSIKYRIEKLQTLSQLLKVRKTELARLITAEMGKVLSEAELEIEKCAAVCAYYAANAEDFLSDKQVATQNLLSYVTYNPLGIILAIMPWNYPFWQVFRAAAPIISAGNTIVLKHASNVIGCALAIEQLFLESGFEKGVLSNVIVSGSEVLKLISDKRIAGVTLTGSTNAGIAVAVEAARNIKKTVLELGGSDPYIILGDADLTYAVEKCVEARLINAGQSCIGAKRFIVDNTIHDQFVELFVDKMSKAQTGNPLEDETTYGPLAKIEFCEELSRQVSESLKLGATLVLGNHNFENDIPLYNPTIITNVNPQTPAYNQELFGPVASIIRAKNEADAIKIANDTNFGLGAAIFTTDLDKGLAIAQNQIQAGICFINDYAKSTPQLPFGGIKQSGYGRELSSWGITEFTNVKTIVAK